MSPKFGIAHDYDLMANAEPAAKARVSCMCCGLSPVVYRWSDYHGEAMCCACGCPYQLKGGAETDEPYPRLNLKPEWVPVLRQYHAETRAFTYLGRLLGGQPPGLREFFEWVELNNAAPPSEEEARDA